MENKFETKECPFCKKELKYNKPVRVWDYEKQTHNILFACETCTCEKAIKERKHLDRISDAFNKILK